MEIWNDDSENIVDSFDGIVDLVNSEGGWTVYGWGKRGLINHVSLLGNDTKDPGDNKVLSQKISTHVVHLYPPRKDYLGLLQFMRGLLTTSKLTFLHCKYVIAINPNVGMLLYI